MPSAPLPSDETQRLEALRRSRILDSDDERSFQDLTELAVSHFGVPIAVVSLVDETREWFKACVGTDTRQSDRTIAFCAYTILNDEPLIVEDATRDPRFVDNPQVTEHGIRFYAGAPIVTADGRRIGAFCLKDRTPRGFSHAHIQDLRRFARLASFMVEARNAQQRAEDATRAKSEFLANMSHEIRTPMTAILGYADLLAEDGDIRRAPTRRVQTIQTIRRNATHLLSLINDILDMSKIEAGKMTVEAAPAAPRKIIEDVVSIVGVRATEKQLRLSYSFATPVPQSVVSDSLRIRQVLMNLIGNGVKFTTRGGVEVTCGMDPGAEPCNGRLWFDVTDTGLGMTQEQLSRLFRPFEQADHSTTRQFGGTGLGLSISLNIARLLGGDIEVSSRFGEGSTFRFHFPVQWSPDTPMLSAHQAQVYVDVSAAEPEAEPAPSQTARALEGLRILVAEDGTDNRRLIEHHLTRAGATVMLVENGQMAVEALTNTANPDLPLITPAPFDLVLLDMQMPVLDGYLTASLLKERGLRIPIIALTAHAMSGDRERCIAAGCDDYATKPIDKHALVAACFRACDPGRARSASPAAAFAV